jgi:plastocyanin/uncharacterized membrane protein
MPVPRMNTSRTGSSLLAAIAAVAVLTIFSISGNAQPSQATTQTIVMKGMGFNPQQATVRAGVVVEWRNEDIFAHTVTADDGSLDSGLIEPGHSWSTTFQQPGTFRYHCRPHPNMTANLVISNSEIQGGQQNGGSGSYAQSLRFRPPTSPHELHPILVNFTAALLPLALLSDILGRIFNRRSFHAAAWWMTFYTAAITPLTVAAGWWWKHAVGPGLPAKLIIVHQWLGTSAAVLFILLAIWRWKIAQRDVPPGVAYLACATIAVLALAYQGSLGGAMLFGR